MAYGNMLESGELKGTPVFIDRCIRLYVFKRPAEYFERSACLERSLTYIRRTFLSSYHVFNPDSASAVCSRLGNSYTKQGNFDEHRGF